MKRYIAGVLCVLAFPIAVFAVQGGSTQGQNGNSGNGLNGTSQGMQGTGAQIQIMNQNMEQTQNQSDEIQIQNREMETLQVGENANENAPMGSGENAQKYGQNRSEAATASMSEVAKKVQEMQMLGQIEKGLGEQIRLIAQNQTQSQQRLHDGLGKVDERQGILKTFLGPDYKAMNAISREIGENELRITQLEQLKNQLANQADATKIQEMIQSLIAQNTALQERIQLEEQTKSMFGWMMKFFAG